MTSNHHDNTVSSFSVFYYSSLFCLSPSITLPSPSLTLLLSLHSPSYCLFTLSLPISFSQPVGLAPKKSVYLKKLSQKLLDDFDGQVPSSYESLESLPGVGHKTASVVMSQVQDNSFSNNSLCNKPLCNHP